MKLVNAKDILKSHDLLSTLHQLLSEDSRYGLLDALRVESLSTERLSALGDRQVFVSSEAIGIQRQVESIDKALETALRADGRFASFLEWTRLDDPDRPSNLEDLRDPLVAYRYTMLHMYRRQFEVTVNEMSGGCWPFIFVDLLTPFDPKRLLLLEQLPESVIGHPGLEFIKSMPLDRLNVLQTVLMQVSSESAQRLAIASDNLARANRHAQATELERMKREYEGTRAICTQVMERERIARAICDANLKAQQDAINDAEKKAAGAAAARDAWERFEREPRAIPHSSDHVDRFDRNGDTIASMA